MAFDPISAGLEIAGKIIDRVWPDKTAQDEAKLEMLKLQIANEFQLQAAQIQVNTAEAASGSMFVAGWRPAIGWICSFALAYQYILRPLVSWVLMLHGSELQTIAPMPGLDDNLWELMLGMLGIGGLRTFEKIKKVA